MEKNKPRPYSVTDKAETEAIDTLEALLNHDKVKSDLKKRDKYPNVDGYLELVDETRTPVGKLEVQVRKLPDGATPKLDIELSLLGYAESSTCNPVLVIGVDTKDKKAYWIDTCYIESITKPGEGQKYVRITFPDQNIIDGKATTYLSRWGKIVKGHKAKLEDYADLKKDYDLLVKKATPLLGIHKAEFHNLHTFLDELNGLLDGKFQLVKKVYYPNSWKVGLTYYEYGERSLGYSLYPIPLDKNDVQIKEIDKELRGEFGNYTGHYAENPIKSRPLDYAHSIIENNILNILNNKRLVDGVDEFLAQEYVISFIDKFYMQLGFGEKDLYTIDEVEKAMRIHLPFWVDEAIKFMVEVKRNGVITPLDCLSKDLQYYDPQSFSFQILKEEIVEIEKRVQARIRNGEIIPNLPINNDKFPVEKVDSFFDLLKSRGFKEIKRIYAPKDYERNKERSSFVWNVFSPEALERNLNTFFENLPRAYNNIIKANFPKLADDLPLFRGASRVIAIFDGKEEYLSSRDAPTIKLYCLRMEEPEDLKIEIYRKDSEAIPKISHENFEKALEMDGKKYKLVLESSGILDFIYKDLPMYEFIYENLEKNMQDYFYKRFGKEESLC